MDSNGPAVVVGGGSGIGAAITARQRAAGIDVVSWDIRGTGDIECDISDPDQIEAAATETLKMIGTPTVATITAGISHAGLLNNASPYEWDRVFDVNTRGVWLAMRVLAAFMAEAGSGSIIAISSVSATLPDSGMGIYCASKAALDMIVRVAAREWAPAVRVNAVAPGVTDTPMLDARIPRDGNWLGGVASRTALVRLGSPEDIATTVMGLHSMHWVTGQILTSDGGLSLHSPVDPPFFKPTR